MSAPHREVLRRFGGQPDALHHHGVAAFREGRYAEACDLIARAVALKPAVPTYRNSLGNALQAHGELDRAISSYQEAIALDPDYASSWHNLGIIYKRLGRFEDAVSCIERVLVLDPHHAPARRNLSLIGGAVPRASQIEQAQRELDRPGLAEQEAMHLHFALGKLFDDVGESARAFEHYRQANTLRRRTLHFDSARHADLCSRIIATFSPELLGSPPFRGNRSQIPVIVCGMPRSGTTLIEQILSSHPRVAGAGEVEYLGWVTSHLSPHLGTRDPFPAGAAQLDQRAANRVANEYLAELRRRGGRAQRITDKSTNHFLFLGLTKLLFPQVRVIHCVRDRADTCLSIYFQYFNQGNPFAYDLRELGSYYREYERLMAHWRTRLGADILDVRYEELTANQEAVSRAMIDFIGLEWHDACLDFHRNARAVTTASSWQVRQPIYRSSVGRWERYREFLGPLLEALGDGDGGSCVRA